MIYKPRTKPQELLLFESLDGRLELPAKAAQYYYSMKKGHAGEAMFDSFLEKLESDVLILNDLLFHINHTTFQVDALVISAEDIYLYEVKNYDGDYIYDHDQDKFYKVPNYEIGNPLHQLARTDSLFQQLLRQHGFSYKVNPFVVFVNDALTLYEAPLHKPIIYPTQLRNHFQQLNERRPRLNKNHRQLADKLVALHLEKSPYTQAPTYEYDQLKKGIRCQKCRSLPTIIKNNKCICMQCQHEESVSAAVMRTVREYQHLFPDEKITTARIHDWCQIVEHKQRIKRILEKHMKKVGANRWTYYT